MIADRIDAYLRTEGIAVPDALLDVAATGFRKTLARNFGERREHRTRWPSPSSKAYCARRLLYDTLDMSENRAEEQPRARLTFALGDAVESLAMLLSRHAGVEYVTPDAAGNQSRLSATINPADWGVEGEPFVLTGNMDCTILGDGDEGEVVGDWKSMSEYGFDDARAAATNPGHKWWIEQADDYIAQIRCYMILLRVLKRGKGSIGLLLAVNKSTGHTCEVVIHRDHDAEVLLVRKLAYVWKHINALKNTRDSVDFTDALGLGAVDVPTALDYIQKNVPRPKFAQTITLTGSNERGDGTKGAVVQIDTVRDSKRHGSGAFVGFRCSYCPFTATCWPGFTLVPLGKPVWRRAATDAEVAAAKGSV